MAGEKRLPQNWLIYGTHVRFLGASRDAWIASWSAGGGAEIIHGTEATPASLSSALNTFPMFSECQAMRLVHAEEASPETLEALSNYLSNPSSSTALLIECAMDLSKTKIPAAWEEIKKLVKSKDCTVKNAPAFVRQMAASANFEVEPRAIAALEEWANGDLSLLPGALDLLFLYRAAEKRVREEDVESLLGAGGTPRLWDLQDALLQKDAASFLKTVAEIEGDPEQAPLAFVGMVSKQMRFLLHLRGLLAAGAQRHEINPRQLDKNLYPFQLKKLFDALPLWPEAHIRQAFDDLYNLDLALKGDPGEPWERVERHLFPCINRKA
jgi:DNA polymerase III delta subunit